MINSGRVSQKRTRSYGLFGRVVDFIETRKPTDRLILRILFFVFVGTLIVSGLSLNNYYQEPTPVSGGTLTEGMVGIPRFINPALAVARADQDVTALIYRGLMKLNPNGELVPDIAESITPSSDGTIYNIVIRKDIRFHDDTPLTARDVSFTIGLMQNADLKSPLRGNWTGVLVEEINEYELNLILPDAYTPFIENLTFGILPRHIWNELPIEQIPFSTRNTDPIGSGPYKIKEIVKHPSGIIDSYLLESFENNNFNSKITNVEIKFFQNETDLFSALKKNEINSTVYLPLTNLVEIRDNSEFKIIEEPTTRIFGVFFNQNRSVVARDKSAREALLVALDRSKIIEETLSGYGVPMTSPIPNHHPTLQSNNDELPAESEVLKTPTEILTNGGWRQNSENIWEKKIGEDTQVLKITLRTTNNPVFATAANAITKAWQEIGVVVEVEQFEQSDLLQSVIRPRDFEAILTGLDMNRAVDLYPFWHSSQREDPGLNIAQYANIEVDALLEKARTSQSKEERDEAIIKAVAIINKETPAIFVFSPSFTYVVREDITITPITGISRAESRFMNITDWHMSSEKLWSFFR